MNTFKSYSGCIILLHSNKRTNKRKYEVLDRQEVLKKCPKDYLVLLFLKPSGSRPLLSQHSNLTEIRDGAACFYALLKSFTALKMSSYLYYTTHETLRMSCLHSPSPKVSLLSESSSLINTTSGSCRNREMNNNII